MIPDQKPVYKPNSVKGKLLKIFEGSSWITYAEIRDHFNRNEAGYNSLDRFKRFLEADGFKIEMRHRSHNCYEYRLIGWALPQEHPDTLFPLERFSYDR